MVELGIWLALVGAAFYLTFDFDEPLQVYRFGAATWPRVIIAAMLISALAQFFLAVRQRHRQESADPYGYWTRLKAAGLGLNLKLLGMFALPLLYVLLMPKAGFYATTPFFIGSYMLLLGERRLRHLIGTTLGIYALTLLVFAKLLFVPLPTGTWPGFYDFSNWLLVFIR